MFDMENDDYYVEKLAIFFLTQMILGEGDLNTRLYAWITTLNHKAFAKKVSILKVFKATV